MKKTIVLVDFHYKRRNIIIEGSVALFIDPGENIPITDEELIDEIRRQYNYEATEILHKRRIKK